MPKRKNRPPSDTLDEAPAAKSVKKYPNYGGKKKTWRSACAKPTSVKRAVGDKQTGISANWKTLSKVVSLQFCTVALLLMAVFIIGVLFYGILTNCYRCLHCFCCHSVTLVSPVTAVPTPSISLYSYIALYISLSPFCSCRIAVIFCGFKFSRIAVLLCLISAGSQDFGELISRTIPNL